MTRSKMIAVAFIAAGLFLTGYSGPAKAVKQAIQTFELSDTQRSDIRDAIRGQLRAFAQRNAVAAYSFAAKPTQQRFGSPQRFLMAMARGYTPVFLTKYIIFEGLLVSGQPIQRVILTDSKGRDWIALYEMQRQSDGNWKILNCALKKAEGWRI